MNVCYNKQIINYHFVYNNHNNFNDMDFKVDSKILKICEMIYLNQNIFFHNEYLNQ